MKCVEMIEPETTVAPRKHAVKMPVGLLGFEQIKDYVLVSNPGEEPFAWLQVEDNPVLAFVVVDPFVVLPEYQPDIPQADVQSLGLVASSDAILLGIVTVHEDGRATMNLKGPVVINRHTHVGRQVIITNAAAYSIQHPLPAAEIGD